MSDVVSLLQRLVFDSPPGEWALKQLRELLIGALKQGPVPRHVAFEMDGNRRYARSHRMETVEGHHRGFEALARVSFFASRRIYAAQVDWLSILTLRYRLWKFATRQG